MLNPAPGWRALALASPLAYAGTAVTVQAAHPRFDWLQAPLSFYLSGPAGEWLQAAYVLLAAGIGALAWACRRLHPGSWFQACASALMVLGAACLVLTALYPGGSPEHAVSPAMHRLHGAVASGAFGFTLLGMLMQGAVDWRHGLRWSLVLASVTLLVLVIGHWPGLLPRGLGQKLAIACYLVCLAWRASRVPKPAAADDQAIHAPAARAPAAQGQRSVS